MRVGTFTFFTLYLQASNFAQHITGSSQVALVLKNPSTNIKDIHLIPGSGRSPGGGQETHSRVLAWRIPGTGEPGELLSMGRKELDTTEAT